MNEADNDNESLENVDVLVEGLKTYIKDVVAALDEDKYTDLVGFDEKVAELCSVMQNIPASKFGEYSKVLEEIGSDLEKLQKTMVAKKDGVEQQIHSLANKKKAGMAYAKSGNIAGNVTPYNADDNDNEQ